MSRVRVWLSRLLVLGVAVLAGVLAFLIVRVSPRLVIRGPLEAIRLSDDGMRLLTARQEKAFELHGPLEVWDLHSGARTNTLIGGERIEVSSPEDNDQLVAAALVDRGRFHVVDWIAGTTRTVDCGPEPFNLLPLSSRWYCTARGEKATVFSIYDMEQSKVVLSPPGELIDIDAKTGRAFYHEPERKRMVVWSLTTGANLAEFEIVGQPESRIYDGSLLTARPEREFWGRDGVTHHYFRFTLWDLETYKPRSSGAKGMTRPAHVLDINDRHVALHVMVGNTEGWLEVLELASGRPLFAVRLQTPGEAGFSPDGKLLYVNDAVLRRTTMYDLDARAELWERPGDGYSVFAGATLIHAPPDEIVTEILDARTGQRKGAPFRGDTQINDVRKTTTDGRYALICSWQQETPAWLAWIRSLVPKEPVGSPKEVRVLDTTAAREILSVTVSSERLTLLSDDGSTVVTDTWDETAGQATIRVWDVSSRRAWIWSGVTTAGAWLTLAGLGVAARLLRRRAA